VWVKVGMERNGNEEGEYQQDEKGGGLKTK
jgi:hypothetical protein